MKPATRVDLADWIVIISMLFADERRAIDMYIDYFGGMPREDDPASRAA